VSLEGAIVERGRMPFEDAQRTAAAGAAGASCGTWWSSSTSLVKRSIFDNFALGISDAKRRRKSRRAVEGPRERQLHSVKRREAWRPSRSLLKR
jgi:hypothetical protein